MLLYIASGWLYTDILSYRIYIDKYGSIIPHILNTCDISPKPKLPPPHSHQVHVRPWWMTSPWALQLLHVTCDLKSMEKKSHFNSQMTDLHPGRLTWKVEITHLERKMIFQTSVIMFHVNLQGCTRSLKQVQSGVVFKGLVIGPWFFLKIGRSNFLGGPPFPFWANVPGFFLFLHNICLTCFREVLAEKKITWFSEIQVGQHPSCYSSLSQEAKKRKRYDSIDSKGVPKWMFP